MDKKTVSKIFEKLYREFPNPTTDLIYEDNFELLIAVILSARTTDKTVNKITQKLFKIANTPEKFINLGVVELKKLIKSSGFFNSKAENIIATCKILAKEYNSRIPKKREQLEKLPGVGRKTANVVLNVAYGKPTIAVDTHVFRLSNRIGFAKGKTPIEVEKKLLQIVPKKFGTAAGHILILHGRKTCTSRKPKCDECVIKSFCRHVIA